MLTNLRLERFKNFKDAELPLGPPTLQVGTNASGKSNLRDAFRFLHGISRGYTLAEIIKRILDIPDTHRILEKQDLAQLHAYGWLEDAVSSLEGSCVQPVPRGVQISHLCWRLRVPPSLPPARVSRAAPLAADRRKYTSHGVNNTLNRRSTGHEQDFQPAMLHCPLAADDPLLSDAMNRTGTGPEQVLHKNTEMYSQLTLIRAGRSAYRIVLAPHASPSERYAAEELQRCLKEMSGAELPIHGEGEATAAGPAIYVGRGPAAERLLGPNTDWTSMGAEDFLLRALPRGAAGRDRPTALIIAGGRPRGTQYGVYELLDRLGCRWFTPTVSRIPRRRTITLPVLDVHGAPDFEYREPFFTEAFDGDWAARSRVNSAHAALDEARGGKITYHHFVHTFDDLVPRELFAAHPEYFPLIQGKRTDGCVQRCLTNPEVLKLATERVLAWIRERPDAMIYSVSQNDTANWCQCDPCRAVTDTEGAHSGLYLRFVNAVAEAVEHEHPDKLIDTLAYQFTEAPPRHVRPRRNVRVRLCPIACCQVHPYEECSFPANIAYVENLKAWAKITNTLYIWHYNTNFAHYLLPFPDFRELAADTAMYRRLGVRGIFFQGAYAPGGGGSDAELRSYVLARLAWNAHDDWDARVTEWLRGVYGPAWRPMRAYFDLLNAQVLAPDHHFTIYSPADVGYLTPTILARANRRFDQAERLAAGDPVAEQYVAKARLSLRYAQIMLRGQTAKAGDAVARTRLAGELQAFMADVRRSGITQLREGQGLEEWEAARRAEWGLCD